MIGIVYRFHRADDVIRYLYQNSATTAGADLRMIAAWIDPATLEPPTLPTGGRNVRGLAGLMQEPLRTRLTPPLRDSDRPAWHCTVTPGRGEPAPTDPQWAELARDILHRTRFAPRGGGDGGCRWIAVRPTDNSRLHIVVTLARGDGTRPSAAYDQRRVSLACAAAEIRQRSATTRQSRDTAMPARALPYQGLPTVLTTGAEHATGPVPPPVAGSHGPDPHRRRR
jgi:hypothetical protein